MSTRWAARRRFASAQDVLGDIDICALVCFRVPIDNELLSIAGGRSEEGLVLAGVWVDWLLVPSYRKPPSQPRLLARSMLACAGDATTF
jgi:hypothetical protein